MAVIHIDGKRVEVDGADNLLAACLSLGIDVPYFCYHPALGSVGSCRQCAVKQYMSAEDYEAGKGRLVMSCMLPAADNTYISVDDEEAKAFRKSIVEFLMTNHPHDCPTCEEGGHCHLQDMTYMSGHNKRRYRFTKRTHHNQEFGAFIAHEMNRCIACYRCVRFYKDYAGGEDFGVYASNNRVYFGRTQDGQFESEFSGNLTEVCPTGVFTDKTHSDRYNRKWDMQYAPSVCHGCSAGCNISAGERYGELRRIENRYNSDVNGYFLCDRGRFGYGYVNREDRPTQAIERINNKNVKINLDYALDETISRLKGKKVIGIGSPRASLESNYALKKLVGVNHFSTGLNVSQQALVEKAIDIQRMQGVHNSSLKDIEQHDAVLILGEDITQTSSRVALSVRQAAKNKAKKMAADLRTQDWLAEPVKRIGQDANSPVYVLDVVQTKLDDIAKVSCLASPNDIAEMGYAIASGILKASNALLSADANGNLNDSGDSSGDSSDSALINTADMGDKVTDHTAKTDTSDASVDGEAEQKQRLIDVIVKDLLTANQPLVISGTSLASLAVLEATEAINAALTAKRTAIHTHQAKQIDAHNQATIEKYQAQLDVLIDETSIENKKQERDKQLKKVNTAYQPRSSIYLAVTDANSIGVCLLGGKTVEEVLASDFDAVVVVENQLTDAIGAAKLSQLLVNKTVIALDHELLDWHKQVDIVLPAASFAEADGTLISAEGRAQRFFQVYDPSYYNPMNTIKASWRWLHAVQCELNQLPVDWTQLDDVIAELVETHPKLQPIQAASPNAKYRIHGLKVAREPRRYSGRTAMRAPISIHEPMQPKDPDTGLTFSMEGYVGQKTDASMIPFAWSAGWNSPQAWNKLQDKVGGKLKAGDVGIRMFDVMQRLPVPEHLSFDLPADHPNSSALSSGDSTTKNSTDSVDAADSSHSADSIDNMDNTDSANEANATDTLIHRLNQQLAYHLNQQSTHKNSPSSIKQLIPVHNLFASGSMASRSPVVQSQMVTPAWYMAVEDAQMWGVEAGDELIIEIDDEVIQLPVKFVSYLAEGCIGYPVGQVPILTTNTPISVSIAEDKLFDADGRLITDVANEQGVYQQALGEHTETDQPSQQYQQSFSEQEG